jgi:hypothetical protein
MSYLRNRPFLTLSYTYVPGKGQDTRQKDFRLTGEYDAVETMRIFDRISDKQMQKCDIILDLFENKFVKCPENDFDTKELFDKIVARYYNDVKEALGEWIKRDPANLERVQRFVELTTLKGQ